jgi:hypothetical protein
LSSVQYPSSKRGMVYVACWKMPVESVILRRWSSRQAGKSACSSASVRTARGLYGWSWRAWRARWNDSM